MEPGDHGCPNMAAEGVGREEEALATAGGDCVANEDSTEHVEGGAILPTIMY